MHGVPAASRWKPPPPRPDQDAGRCPFARAHIVGVPTSCTDFLPRKGVAGMQFHLDGYTVGDPMIRPAASDSYVAGEALPAQVDVLVVGTGPAGCVLAAQLAAFPDIHTRVVERRDGPLKRGHADGVACRTVEMLGAFGVADAMLSEAYWVNEVAFWGPDARDPESIVRLGHIQDTEDGLSEMPHVTVNQARLQELLLQRTRSAPSRLQPDYGVEVIGLEVDRVGDHPVRVDLRTENRDFRLRAKYVVGCDGARSQIRRAIGRELHGDRANHAWGVLDLLAVTDYPDWRKKVIIQSQRGNLLLIPREGGYLVRVYVDLGEAHDRETIRAITVDGLIAATERAIRPYELDVREVAWSSIYEVGQRLTDKFDDVPAGEEGSRAPRVFIAGDACHTHSAKAGQGMNVSMQDTFNLGWKLAAVLQGRSEPGLLHTYSVERQAVAQELIDFDKAWSTTIAQRPLDTDRPELGGIDPSDLQAAFTASGRYTAGLATRYTTSPLTAGDEHQALAAGFPVGMRLHSSPVLRIADGKEMQLGHVHEADGRWRIYVFADAAGARALELLERLGSGLVPRFTPAGADPDSVFDIRAVFQQSQWDVELKQLPSILRPAKGRLRLRDYEKAFSSVTRTGTDIYELRGIDPRRGAVIVVRPDQYVAAVMPLDASQELESYFGGILLAA